VSGVRERQEATHAAVAAKISASEAIVKTFIEMENRPVRQAMMFSRLDISSTLFSSMMAAMGSMQASSTVMVRAKSAMERCE